MKSTSSLLWAMLAHFAVDAAAVAALTRVESNVWFIGSAILLYDALAFATQPLFGLIADRKRTKRVLLAGGLIFAGAGSVLFHNPILIATVCGLGNAAAHIGGFGMMFEHQNGKVAPLGLFVSAGSLGLGMGTLFSSFHLVYAILALVLGIFFLIVKWKAPVDSEIKAMHIPGKPILFLPMLAVLLSVFLRGFAGTLASGEYAKTTVQASFVYVAIFAGKALGGFLADRLGMFKTVLIFFAPSVVGLVLFRDIEWVYLLSLCLFNISMPVCLALAIALLRKLPAFAFGLTAALLMIGTFFALFLQTVGIEKTPFLIASALFAALGMLYAIHKIKKEAPSCISSM